MIFGDSDHRRAILEAIIVDTEYEELYDNSATFHTQLQMFCDMLPSMIEGMALSAYRRREAGMRELERLMVEPTKVTLTAEQASRLLGPQWTPGQGWAKDMKRPPKEEPDASRTA